MMTRNFLKEGQWKACKIQQPLRKGWNFVFAGHGSAFYRCHPCHLIKHTDAARCCCCKKEKSLTNTRETQIKNKMKVLVGKVKLMTERERGDSEVSKVTMKTKQGLKKEKSL